ncbi:MAG TPA: Beta-galactosidase C-terminal domain, partial [Anaerolineales bacterium]|nr:Beta-galactosidase C-terminal domain [Anaerolineales bacterium]
KIWAERLKILDANLTIPVARYGAANGWLDGQVAVAVHPFGQGMVYYVGTWLDEASQQKLIDHILTTAGIQSIKTPVGVEVRTRTSPAGTEIYFVINHTRTEQSINLPWPAHEHLTEQDVSEKIQLPPYEVAILTKAAGNHLA